MKTLLITLMTVVLVTLASACGAPATSTNTTTANANAAKPATDTTAKPATETAAKPAGDDNVFTNQEAGVTFTVPAGWKAEPNNEQIQVSSPDGSVTIVMWVPDEDFQAASKAIGDQIDQQLENVKTDGEGNTVKINGMDAFELTGTGTYEGTAVHWAVDLIKAKKPFIALSIGESEKLQQHMAGYKSLVGSIKPV